MDIVIEAELTDSREIVLKLPDFQPGPITIQVKQEAGYGDEQAEVLGKLYQAGLIDKPNSEEVESPLELLIAAGLIDRKPIMHVMPILSDEERQTLWQQVVGNRSIVDLINEEREERTW